MIKIIIGLAKKATRNFLVVFALKISTYYKRRDKERKKIRVSIYIYVIFLNEEEWKLL